MPAPPGARFNPDWIPQFSPGRVTALHPDSERRALEGTLALIDELT